MVSACKQLVKEMHVPSGKAEQHPVAHICLLVAWMSSETGVVLAAE
jgi:hypothetical protein